MFRKRKRLHSEVDEEEESDSGELSLTEYLRRKQEESSQAASGGKKKKRVGRIRASQCQAVWCYSDGWSHSQALCMPSFLSTIKQKLGEYLVHERDIVEDFQNPKVTLHIILFN